MVPVSNAEEPAETSAFTAQYQTLTETDHRRWGWATGQRGGGGTRRYDRLAGTNYHQRRRSAKTFIDAPKEMNNDSQRRNQTETDPEPKRKLSTMIID